jgi:hypothetical protein
MVRLHFSGCYSGALDDPRGQRSAGGVAGLVTEGTAVRVGVTAGATFGPLMRFVCGTGVAADGSAPRLRASPAA